MNELFASYRERQIIQLIATEGVVYLGNMRLRVRSLGLENGGTSPLSISRRKALR